MLLRGANVILAGKRESRCHSTGGSKLSEKFNYSATGINSSWFFMWKIVQWSFPGWIFFENTRKNFKLNLVFASFSSSNLKLSIITIIIIIVACYYHYYCGVCFTVKSHSPSSLWTCPVFETMTICFVSRRLRHSIQQPHPWHATQRLRQTDDRLLRRKLSVFQVRVNTGLFFVLLTCRF